MQRLATLSVLFLFGFTSVYGALIIATDPVTTIEGPGSGIDRPEGLAFAPDGSLLAVANYFSDEITLYSRIGESGSLYETTPSTVIGGPESGIHYPHDVAFSPDGSHLAVASRLSNRVTIYGKDAQGQFSSTPLYTLMGKDAKLYVADALSYVPGKNMLAVVYIYSDRVNFYRYNEGGYVTKPFFILKDSSHIKKPDGVAFSADGSLMAVTIHDDQKVALYRSAGKASKPFHTTPAQMLQGEELVYPHSLGFHPSGNYLAISSAGGRKSVNIFERASGGKDLFDPRPVISLEIYNPETIHLQEQNPLEGGVKGVAFSPDGHSLAVCASDLGDMSRSIMIFAVQEAD